MKIKEKLINLFYKTATGGKKKRIVYALFGGTSFLIASLLFIIVPLYLDKLFQVKHFYFYPINQIISVIFLISGITLVVWSINHFYRVRGTPVPFNPPPKLVVAGPFKYTRNPMTTGYFMIMLGTGILFGSLLCVFIFTPLYIFTIVIELKKIEEPELEKRLGNDYAEYKRKVPMFFPRIFKKGSSSY